VHGDSATVAGVSEVLVMQHPLEVEKGNHHLIGARNINVSVFLSRRKI